MWQALCLHFGTLETILALGGHPVWQQEGHVAVRNQIFCAVVLRCLRDPFWKYFQHFGATWFFCPWALSGYLLCDFLVWIWLYGAWKVSISYGRVCKTKPFTDVGFLLILGSIVDNCWWPWDQPSWFLVPWKQFWNLMIFMVILGGPTSNEHTQIGVIWLLVGSLTSFKHRTKYWRW